MAIVKLNGIDTEVDDEIAQLVLECNKMGLQTTSSCAGHGTKQRPLLVFSWANGLQLSASTWGAHMTWRRPGQEEFPSVCVGIADAMKPAAEELKKLGLEVVEAYPEGSGGNGHGAGLLEIKINPKSKVYVYEGSVLIRWNKEEGA